MKYKKELWQFVSEAVDNIGKEIFTASDIIKKIHGTNPEVPKVSIRTFVIAMAPNHPTSHHYPSTRRNHPYFYYLGDGKYRLLKPTDGDTIVDPPPTSNEKDGFMRENRECIVAWATEHQTELIAGRKNYGISELTAR